MKRFLIPIAMTVAAIFLPAYSADVGVSVTIGHPGFFGQLDLGHIDVRPPVIYMRPVQAHRVRRGEVVEPVYMRVPRRETRNWRRYCSRYQACGRPVYFVRDDWYSNVYAPQYRERHRQDHRQDHREDRRDERRDERREDRRDDRNDRRDDHRNDRHDRGDRR